jgi:two-component system, OmpR family, sensor kinase
VRSPPLARLRERTPLRTQLVLAVLVLSAIVVVTTSVTAAVVLRGQLLNRVDQQLAESARPVAEAFAHDGRGGDRPRPGGDPVPTRYAVALLDSSGAVVQTLDPQLAGETSRPALPRLDTAEIRDRAGEPFTVDAESGTGSWRVVVLPTTTGGGVVVGLPLDDVNTTVAQLLAIDAVVGGLALAVLAGLAWWAVRTSLRPLEEVEETADAIAAGDFARRIPRHDPRTEVGRLAAALNTMLGQIEGAFTARMVSERAARTSEQRMRRFVADASHELRTPLASIRGFAELYRQGAVHGTTDVARVIRRIEDEAARMGLLVEDLLLLARLDQQRPLERKPVDLLPIVTDVVHAARVVAPEHDVRLHVAPASHLPVVYGDELRLRQVVSNLVTNAVVHTPKDTRVDVSLTTANGEGRLEVRDTGPGFAAEDAARMFERFYRADPARARTSTTGGGSGSGLGLSIVAALVAAHHGRVEANSAPGEGATFRVFLPVAAETHAAETHPVGDAPDKSHEFPVPSPD